jgi:hypothetical protein
MKEELLPLPEISPGLYRHYRGGLYEVMGVARHSETLEALVVYRPIDSDTGWWVRPHAMFVETGLFEGRIQPRFAQLNSEA